MAGEGRSNLKLVGGNKHLRPMPKSRRVPPWPPLRVVGVDYVPPTVSAPQPLIAAAKTDGGRRPTWGLLWAAGFVVALAQGIEQAIAAYYG